MHVFKPSTEGWLGKYEDNTLTIERPTDSRIHKSLHGTTRQLVFNAVQGTKEGFTKELEIRGVGYQASNQGTGAIHPSGIENVQFTNCIINGSLPDEVEIIAEDSSTIQLNHCLIRSQNLVNASIASQCIFNEIPGFFDPGLRNFKLTETSVARDAGMSVGIVVDRGNQTRDGMPDIGCWEYQ